MAENVKLYRKVRQGFAKVAKNFIAFWSACPRYNHDIQFAKSRARAPALHTSDTLVVLAKQLQTK